jgi:hypothetical protein
MLKYILWGVVAVCGASAFAGEQSLFPGESVTIGNERVSCVGRAAPKDFQNLSDLVLLSFEDGQLGRCFPIYIRDHFDHVYKLFRYRGVFDGVSENDPVYARAHLIEMTRSSSRNRATSAKDVASFLRPILASGICDR